MKILFVISELPPTRSGVAVVGEQLVAGYRQAGHEVDTLSRSELPFLVMGEVRLSALAWHWRTVRPRVAAADLVHLHGPAPSWSDVFLLGLAAGRDGPPVIYSHNFEIHFRGLAALCRLYEQLTVRLARRAAARVVVATTQQARRLPGRNGRVAVIPWGCDHRAGPAASPLATDASAPASRPLRVLFVGQMRPYKGVPVLIEALATLSGVEAVLVGGGPRLERYRRQAARKAPGALLPGALPDDQLDERLRWADVMVLPSISRQEAFGLVLLEGMHNGCVPVASDLPGVREVVDDAGELVPPGDAAALAGTLRRLRDDPDRRAELARRAVARAAGFSWRRCVDGYLELAGEVAGSGRKAPPGPATGAVRP